MGGNKIACAHITRENIRLMEGRVQSGVMLISRTATVPKASRFFHGERLAYMSDMVSTIINSMQVNSFTAKDIHIVYDNGVEVSFFLDEKLMGQKSEKKGKAFEFGKKKSTDGSAGKTDKSGKITHKKAWGKFITESEQGELYTTTVIERDLVNFMISEFQEHGIRVASIEAPETALLYLRKFVPFTYDELNKLVVYANDKISGFLYQFTKDAPAGNKPFHFDDIQVESFVDQTVGVIKEEIRKSALHNPHIMLVGDAFANPDEYKAIAQALKEEGLFNIDIYGLWYDRGAPLNSIRVVTPDDLELEIGGQYGICVCLLIRALEAKPENMIEGFHPMFIRKQEKQMLAELLSFGMALFLIYNILSCGFGVYENYVAQGEFTRASNTTEVQLTMAQQKRDAVRAKVDALGTIDSRYNDIFKFVYAQVDDNLNIASVDTLDMIPATGSTSSNYVQHAPTDASVISTPNGSPSNSQAAETPSTTTPAAAGTESTGSTAVPGPVDVTGSSNQSIYKMQTIVIRGYSRTTEGPIKLHNALVEAGLGEVKVVGIEQVPLPSNETLFAFELTVGTNEGG